MQSWLTTAMRWALVLGILTLFGAGTSAPARAEQAAPGQYLPNVPLLLPESNLRKSLRKHLDLGPQMLEPPSQQYETRLGWLVSVHSAAGKDARLLALRVLQSELVDLSGLSQLDRDRYLLGLVRDLSTMEAAELKTTWMKQLAGSILIDLVANGFPALGATQLNDIIRESTATAVKGAVYPTALSASGQLLQDALSKSNSSPYALVRQEILKIYLKNRCGCDILDDKRWGPSPGWVPPIVPAVRGDYRTALARLMATEGEISWISTGMIPPPYLRNNLQRMVNEEIKRFLRLKQTDRFSYIAQLLLDVETLQKELLEKQSGNPAASVVGSVSWSLATSIASSGVGAGALAMPAALSLVVSAVGTGTSGWGRMSRHVEVLIHVAALRRVLLHELEGLPCMCRPGQESTGPFKVGFSGPAVLRPGQAGRWLVTAAGGIAPYTALFLPHSRYDGGVGVSPVEFESKVELAHTYSSEDEFRATIVVKDSSDPSEEVRFMPRIRTDSTSGAARIDGIQATVEGPREVTAGAAGNWKIRLEGRQGHQNFKVDWGDGEYMGPSDQSGIMMFFIDKEFVVDRGKPTELRSPCACLPASHTYARPGRYLLGATIRSEWMGPLIETDVKVWVDAKGP